MEPGDPLQSPGLPRSIKARDRLNLLSQVLIKGVSIPYGLIVVALATRFLPQSDSYLMLQAANLMTLPGLLQLGMGYLVLREVSNAWAREGHLPDLPVVRTAFLVIFAVTTAAMVAAIVGAVEGWLIPALLPIVIVSLIGQWAIVADYVRLAKGEVLKSNLLILMGNLFCAGLVGFALVQTHPSATLVIFGGLAAPFLASIASFALLLRDPGFRALLSPTGERQLGPSIRQAFPMLLYAIGFSLMLVIPLGSAIIPWIPALDYESLACLRLTTSVTYLYVFLLQPLGPMFLRSWHGAVPSQLAANSRRMLAGLAAICVLSGLIFAASAPPFVHVWLDGVSVSTNLAFQWGAIVTLSLLLLTTVYFCQNTSRPRTAALCLILVDLLMLTGPAVGLSIEWSMIISIGAGAVFGSIAFSLAIREQMELTARRAAPV